MTEKTLSFHRNEIENKKITLVMNINFQTISKSPLFKGVPVNVIQQEFEQLHYRVLHYAKNDTIVQRGNQLEEIRIVLSGHVRSEIDTGDHITKVADLHAPMVLAPGFLFGKENVYPVNVIANVDTEILCMPKSEFMKLMQMNKDIMSNYLDIISSRAQFLAKRIQLLSLRTIKQKIAKYLLDLAEDKLQNFELPMTQTKLAEYFAVARPPLTKAFADLNKDGIIDIKARTVYILNKQALQQIVTSK